VTRIDLTVNGAPCRLDTDPDVLLVDVLRDTLGLTGTKRGCSIGVCGLCAVIVDDRLMSSCLLFFGTLGGSRVRTVESLARDGSLSPLQKAFITEGGFQCGICTPGQLVTATALLEAHPVPTMDEIREWMTSSLCRCTGYHGILDAIRAVAGDR